MFKTAMLALSAASLIAVPSAASAKSHDWNRGHKVRTVQTVRYVPTTRYVTTRYASPYYGSGYYGSPYYGSYGSYGSPYYGSNYGYSYGSPYYGSGYYNGYRCNGNSTAGALIGGALGAVVGSQVAKGRC